METGRGLGQETGQEIERLRRCRKCLTRDMVGQEEYFRTLQEYIGNLDPEVKTDPVCYEGRLAVCKECDQLLEGMCRRCGCYVELRAAVAGNICPGKKW